MTSSTSRLVSLLRFGLCSFWLLPIVACHRSGPTDSSLGRRMPNILVIVADDLGYADAGFQGADDIPTPNLDALAQRGIRCTSGYATHPFCSPSRAGFLTGRYQQRFGHENNPGWRPDDPRIGLPQSQPTLAQTLALGGYATGAVGKWHLGAHPAFHPNARGFADYFGFLGGGHVYLPAALADVESTGPLDRNGRPEPLHGYLTTELGQEAAGFVRRADARRPWFLYLAFSAPHTPLQTTLHYRNRVANITDPVRRVYAGMVVALDDAVGMVFDALRARGLEDDTLVFFFSDNGGSIRQGHANNAPLRGDKGRLYEGGIRVPFLVSWPARLPQGVDYDQPVLALDVFATAAALAAFGPDAAMSGASLSEDLDLDGVNLLPFLAGSRGDPPHEELRWRTGGGQAFAIRRGRWKWVRHGRRAPGELYDLRNDIGERNNLAARRPEITARLEQAVLEWNGELVEPLWESPGPAGGGTGR